MYGQAGFYLDLPRHPAVPGGRASRSTCGSRRSRTSRRSSCAFGLAVGVSFGWRYLLQMSAFWIVDVRGPNQLGMLAAHFLCGAFLPIVFFPGWLEAPVPGPALRLHGPGADRDLAGAAHGRRSARRCSRSRSLWLAALVGLGRLVLGAGGPSGGGAGWLSAIADLRVWRRLVGARIRADWQYRTSFFLFLLSQTLVACLDLAVIAAIFTPGGHARRLVGRGGGAAVRPERGRLRAGRPAHQRRSRTPRATSRPAPSTCSSCARSRRCCTSPPRSSPSGGSVGSSSPSSCWSAPSSSRRSTGARRPSCSCPSRW